jgi:hypothetical protein
VNIVAGEQHGFNWRSLAASSIGAGVNYQLQQQGLFNGNTITDRALSGATRNLVTQGAGVLVKARSGISWTGVATAGIESGVQAYFQNNYGSNNASRMGPNDGPQIPSALLKARNQANQHGVRILNESSFYHNSSVSYPIELNDGSFLWESGAISYALPEEPTIVGQDILDYDYTTGAEYRNLSFGQEVQAFIRNNRTLSIMGNALGSGILSDLGGFTSGLHALDESTFNLGVNPLTGQIVDRTAADRVLDYGLPVVGAAAGYGVKLFKGRSIVPDKLSLYGTTIDSEINAIKNLGQRRVSPESAARRARIDEISQGLYQRRLETDLAGQDYVYRAVRAGNLQYYENGISGPLGSPTYFSLEGGESFLEHMTKAQMRDKPDLLLRIPTSEIKSPSVARPYGYTPESMRPTQYGWEYKVNSYPQYGKGGYHQFIGTTEKFDPSWIYQDWSK